MHHDFTIRGGGSTAISINELHFRTWRCPLGFGHMGVYRQLQQRRRCGGPLWRRLRRPSCYQTQRDLGTCRGSQGSRCWNMIWNLDPYSGYFLHPAISTDSQTQGDGYDCRKNTTGGDGRWSRYCMLADNKITWPKLPCDGRYDHWAVHLAKKYASSIPTQYSSV